MIIGGNILFWRKKGTNFPVFQSFLYKNTDYLFITLISALVRSYVVMLSLLKLKCIMEGFIYLRALSMVPRCVHVWKREPIKQVNRVLNAKDKGHHCYTSLRLRGWLALHASNPLITNTGKVKRELSMSHISSFYILVKLSCFKFPRP